MVARNERGYKDPELLAYLSSLIPREAQKWATPLARVAEATQTFGFRYRRLGLLVRFEKRGKGKGGVVRFWAWGELLSGEVLPEGPGGEHHPGVSSPEGG